MTTPIAPSDAAPSIRPGMSSATSMKWAALQDAASAVAALAGLPEERSLPAIRNFPVLIRNAPGWRMRLAEQGIDDLAAVMEPGLAALLAVNARGTDARHAALALWQEFHAARAAILELAPESGALGPQRSA